jgi:hypothetical protein
MTASSSSTVEEQTINIKDKITPEQWERLNAVANNALTYGYFTEDGQTKRAEIEAEAVERFVNFLEMYYVIEES